MSKNTTEQLDMRTYQDGTTDIIYWDNKNGNDVSISVNKDGVITMNGKEITMKDFITKVKEVSFAENVSASF